MPAHPWEQRAHATAAPALTGDGRCSECKAPATLICEGAVMICPKCLAVLWHSEVRRQTPQQRPAEQAPEHKPAKSSP
jgi:hypothetical protein